MFTGIIEGTGEVLSLERSGSRSRARLRIRLGRRSRGLKIGDSVAINGACLTAVVVRGDAAEFEIIDETARRTNLGSLKQGDRVNIERSLAVGDRLEGHFVLGHVDGTGTISGIKRVKGQVEIRIRLPKALYGSAVNKGSIAVDGISLTVGDAEKDSFSAYIIPHTMAITNLASRKVGDKVNIEADILRKYILSMR
ncbi:MAG: riboflavin synthase [Candidatus Micrarchaeota archaeon]|nr:riboflavin synthase [Candidatus Micrarchaeota archaeon]